MKEKKKNRGVKPDRVVEVYRLGIPAMFIRLQQKKGAYLYGLTL
jgi:hypothetical protein